MPDVDGRWKAGPKQSGGQGSQAVYHQRGAGRIGVACGLGGLDVLQRADEVKERHGNDDRQKAHQLTAADGRKEVGKYWEWQVKVDLRQARTDGSQTRKPGE